MTDIYDIKNTFLWFVFDLHYSLFYLTFIIILIILYKILNKKENVVKVKQEEKEVKQIDFKNILKLFTQKYLEKKSEVFYSKLIEILREILEKKWYKNMSKMTFEEISKIKIDEDLKNLIKNIYFKEYQKSFEDTKEKRLDFIDKIKKII